jgi:hypothetical protein
MAPEDGRVFMFFEQYHFAYTGLPFVDHTLDLFFVVSYAALLQSKT